MIFTLGSLTFNECNTLDDNGVLWGLNVGGWWDAPELRSDTFDLPLRDGSYVSDAYRSSRVLSLEGTIIGGSVEATAAALTELKTALDIVREDGVLTAYEPDYPKFLAVRRASAIEVTWHDGVAVTWGVTLVAADWRKYSVLGNSLLLGPYTVPTSGLDLTASSGVNLGLDETASSGVDLGLDYTGSTGAYPDQEAVNAGSAVVFPVIEFRGPSSSSMTSFKITNLTSGDVLEIDTTVNAGESLLADMGIAYGIKAGSPVTLNGVTRYGGWVSPRTPWGLQPGTNLLRFQVLAGTSTGATAFVTWRSGWE